MRFKPQRLRGHCSGPNVYWGARTSGSNARQKHKADLPEFVVNKMQVNTTNSTEQNTDNDQIYTQSLREETKIPILPGIETEPLGWKALMPREQTKINTEEIYVI